MFIKYGLYLRDSSGHFIPFKDDFSNENHQRIFDTEEDAIEYMNEIHMIYGGYLEMKRKITKRSGFLYLTKSVSMDYKFDQEDRELIKSILKNLVVKKHKINIFREIAQ